MNTLPAAVHLAIYVWWPWETPSTAEAHPASLCPVGRGALAQLTDHNGEVTCPECLVIMDRFLL